MVLNQTAVALVMALTAAWFFLVFLNRQLVCQVNTSYIWWT